MPIKSIVKIACGGMHTLALASSGAVYSWGCNDEGALGRSGTEILPGRVDGSLDEPMNNIAAGDCHSIVYNTDTNKVFFWGCYKGIVDGKTSEKVRHPVVFAEHIFNNESKDRIKKIVCGA